MKRTLLFFCLITFLSPLYTQQYWIQKPSPTTKWLTRIQFIDTLFGWASGDSGIIIHTSNSGQNWIIQNSGTLSLIDDMMFINRTRGWAIANDVFNRTKILKTTNGGINWQISNSPDSTVLFKSIYFYDQQTGYLGGAFPGKIFKTTNEGSSWFETRIDTNSCPGLYSLSKSNFSFLNAQTGFVSGGHIDLQGMIWKTTDSGQNWFTYCVAPEPLIRIKALYSHKTIAVGGDFENGLNIVQTVDSGRTWLFYHPQNISGIGQALAFRTPSELWMPTGFGQKWVLSLDSGGHGKPWYVIPCPNNEAIYDAMFVTPSFGWACGNDGILLKYNSDIIGISENGNTVPIKCVLFQNYPNPFNPVTTISYLLNQKAYVRIIIYDAVGKEVYSHVEGSRQTGMHEFIFSAENLASGIYIYKIDAGGFTEAKKMVIIK